MTERIAAWCPLLDGAESATAATIWGDVAVGSRRGSAIMSPGTAPPAQAPMNSATPSPANNFRMSFSLI